MSEPTPEPSLGDRAAAFDSSDIQQTLDAEQQLQNRACRTTAAVEPALLEALCRRVHRALTMRNLPLGVQPLGDGGFIRPGTEDAEVRRLERPFRKLVVG